VSVCLFFASKVNAHFYEPTIYNMDEQQKLGRDRTASLLSERSSPLSHCQWKKVVSITQYYPSVCTAT
jgi:hypothetical protein